MRPFRFSWSWPSPAVAAEADTKSPWKVPRTAAGHPDLQGTWTTGTATPFERPVELAGAERLSADQAAAFEKRFEDFRTHRSFKDTDVGHDNEAFMDIGYKVLPTLQPSQVVSPQTAACR